MAKDIEQLSIKIDANAQGASQALNSLIKQIDGVSNAMRGFDASQMISQLKQIGTATKGINASNLTKQLNSMADAMGKYAKNLAKANRENASTNSAFYHLTKSTASMYYSLDRVNSKINTFISKFRTASKVTENFAQKVGLLYARFFLLIRGVKSLTKMVKSSMDYIEVMNYFESSFGQVAKDSVSQWADAGYESAQAYYDSFEERAKKVTADMSGFMPNANGLLESTGMKSLGMNPSELIQYQTQFAQMANSMGTTGEQALKLSEVLTKIGADLASVKNMEFKDVWGDMASGLVGMSRTLDKYGVNIRASAMEMKLHELGINANVNSLSQADKALLRTIILLDSSKYAWADLAETINTPANQFRILANNVKLLGQMIGQILLPIVAKVLPYINAFIIALQRLFMWLAKILHIDLSGLMANNKKGGADNSGLSDILDDAEDLGGQLDNDTDSAKKLKKQLQGFDALNNLTSNEDSSKAPDLGKLASGLLNDAFLDAIDDYLKAWQDAFDSLEDKAKAIADKIVAFFKHLAAPLMKAWEEVGDFVVSSWKKAFYAIQGLLKVIAKDFWKVWDEDATTEIFKNILYILGDIGLVVRNLAAKFKIAWMTNNNGYHILADIRDIILIITNHLKSMADATVEWSKSLNLVPLFSKFEEFLNSLKPVVDNIMGVIEDFYTQVMLPLSKWVLEKGLPDLLQVFIDFNEKVDWERIRNALSRLWEHLEPFAERVGEGLIIFVERISDAIANWVNNGGFDEFIDKISDFLDKISAEDVANLIEKFIKALIALKVAVLGFKIGKGLGNFLLWCNNVKKAMAGLKFAKTAKELGVLGKVVQSFSGGTGLMNTFKAIKFAGSQEGLSTILGAGTGTEIGATLGLYIGSAILSALAGFKIGKKLGALITGDNELYENFTWFEEGGFFDSLGYMFTDMIPNALSEAGRSISEWAAQAKNDFNDWKDNTKAGFAEWKEQAGETIDGWKQNVSDSVDESKTKFNEWSEETGTVISTWYEEKVKPYFTKDKWLETYDNLKTALKEKWDETVGQWIIDIEDWWNNDVVAKLDASKWSEALRGLPDEFKKKFEEARKKVGEVFRNLVSDVKRWIGDIKTAISNLKFDFDFKLPSISNLKNSFSGRTRSAGMFANGGFPSSGQLFIAREAGAEMVGSLGNKTTVANNDQIVNGIASGVYNANQEQNELLRQQNSLLQAILEKDTGISASSIFKSVQDSATSYYRMTGNRAFT